MRLQPPKYKFDYSEMLASKEKIIDFIGYHRVLFSGGETNVNDYFNGCDCTKSDFLSLFPLTIQHLAEIYWENTGME